MVGEVCGVVDNVTGVEDQPGGPLVLAEDGSLAPIIIAVVIISLIAAGALLLILHFKKLLPQGFYK